jgi:hypothetical protein
MTLKNTDRKFPEKYVTILYYVNLNIYHNISIHFGNYVYIRNGEAGTVE